MPFGLPSVPQLFCFIWAKTKLWDPPRGALEQHCLPPYWAVFGGDTESVLLEPTTEPLVPLCLLWVPQTFLNVLSNVLCCPSAAPGSRWQSCNPLTALLTVSQELDEMDADFLGLKKSHPAPGRMAAKSSGKGISSGNPKPADKLTASEKGEWEGVS